MLGGLGLALYIRGTAFERRVWQELRVIPAGQTASYAKVVQNLGSLGAV
jgi:AraC family transcriptional regulator of adaptative response/methylated-DNA-[protein]-cysteine methyltransferase